MGMFVFRFNARRILKIDGAHHPEKSRVDVICAFLKTSMMAVLRATSHVNFLMKIHCPSQVRNIVKDGIQDLPENRSRKLTVDAAIQTGYKLIYRFFLAELWLPRDWHRVLNEPSL
ncbi:hypothetical protein [Pararhizobium sp. PWRC1-1]|uniref:hypothetical protein n=1 Tax=Pararhizobium sp. PWRC1-1 TaxID=2804566 RepID=UPI003CEBF9CA